MIICVQQTHSPGLILINEKPVENPFPKTVWKKKNHIHIIQK